MDILKCQGSGKQKCAAMLAVGLGLQPEHFFGQAVGGALVSSGAKG